ncbi:MAG: TolC family protein [Gemmatimonadota bacterium]|nr:MAG: TolC family protein [Gemmatimonadota bacterium]
MKSRSRSCQGVDLRMFGLLLFILSTLFLGVSHVIPQETDLDFSEPLTIDACIEIAKRNAPSIKTAQFALKSAEANVLGAWANMFPSVNASVTGYRTTYGPQTVPKVDQTTGLVIGLEESESEAFSSYSSRIYYGISVFNKGNWSNLSRQQANQRASEFDVEITEQDLIYRVKEAYYGLLAYQRLLQVHEETVRSREENLRKIESMFEVGSASKADVLKQKVQVQNAKASLIQARNDVEYARANLAFTLGFHVNTPLQIVDVLDIEEPGVELEEGLDFALGNHPSLLRAEAQLNAAKAYVGYTQAAFWPSLGAGGSYSWGPGEKLSRIKEMFDKNYNWNLGLQLSFDIPDFSTIANIRYAKAERARSEEQLVETRGNISLAVKKAYLDLNAAKEIITAREEEVASAEEDLKFAEERYRVGAGTALELIDAQVNSTSAQSNHVQALYDYKLALAQLERAIGKEL